MPNPTDTVINRIVRAYVAEATGIALTNVIPAHDPAPAPNGLYATVHEIVVEGEGIDAESFFDNAGFPAHDPPIAPDPEKCDIHSKGNRIGTFSVIFYRTGADDAAKNLLKYSSTSKAQIFFAKNNIVWKKAGHIRHLDEVYASKWEARRGIDIDIRYEDLRIDTFNRIGSAEISLKETSDGVDYTETMEVTE